MTPKNKKLLLTDLCARLPYGVIVEDRNGIHELTTWNAEFTDLLYNSKCNIKPYLFPLSSMTEEQKKYVTDRWGINENFDFEIDPNWGKYFVELGDVLGFINWCYENHLDINGLIPKGLSLDATDKNVY